MTPQPQRFMLSVCRLQEIDTLIGSANSHAWTRKLTEALSGNGYTRVKSILLRGMLLNVFVLRECLPHTLHIESEYTRTGLAGLWILVFGFILFGFVEGITMREIKDIVSRLVLFRFGQGVVTQEWKGNKGGVSIRLDIGGVNLCFVNCHLAAHQDDVSSRIEDFSSIVEDQKFKDEDVDNILDHDYIFWLGDMNFRIDNMDRETILDHISQKKYDTLLANDQLLLVKQQELAFIDFQEGELDFAPTYRFDQGSDVYDTSAKQRLPAWTDRVLWMTHEDAFHQITLATTQLYYTSVPSYQDSDHKPVIAAFDIVVFDKLPKPADITFSPVHTWTKPKSAMFTYTIAADVETSTSDWIGLFQENFPDFDSYSDYVYAKAGKPGSQVTHSFSANQLKDKRGCFRLCYFNSANSVLGSSESFYIDFPSQRNNDS